MLPRWPRGPLRCLQHRGQELKQQVLSGCLMGPELRRLGRWRGEIEALESWERSDPRSVPTITLPSQHPPPNAGSNLSSSEPDPGDQTSENRDL